MVLSERNNTSELVRNGRRSRGPSPNNHGGLGSGSGAIGGGGVTGNHPHHPPPVAGTPDTSSDDDNCK